MINYLKSLKLPDVFSLTGLFLAWIGIIFIFQQKPLTAIFTMLCALFFDYLDGFAARKLKVDSIKGRYLDTFVDIVSYLVFSSLFYFVFLSPNIVVGAVVGGVILIFGVLRLLRYSREGIVKDETGDYYRGVTVLHINLLIVLGNLLYVFGFFNAWLFALTTVVFSLLMLSDYKTHKSKVPVIWLVMLVAALFMGFQKL